MTWHSAIPTGSEALVVDNTSSATRPFTVSWDEERSFSSTLPAGAVATYRVDSGRHREDGIGDEPG